MTTANQQLFSHLVTLSWVFLLPLIPAILIYKALPVSKIEAAGPFRGLRLKLSGAFGGYFLLLLSAISLSVWIQQADATRSANERDRFKTDFEMLQAKQPEFAKLKDENERLSLDKQNLVQDIKKLETKLETTRKSATDTQKMQSTDNQQIWTLFGQVKFMPNSNYPEKLSTSSISISVYPPPKISREGYFTVPIIMRKGAGESYDFPIVRFDIAKFGQEEVPVDLSENPNKSYTFEVDEIKRRIRVKEMVSIQYLETYPTTSPALVPANSMASKVPAPLVK